MAEKQLRIDVIVESNGAVTSLKNLDDAMARLSDRSLTKISTGVSTLDKELANLQKSADKAAEATERKSKSTQNLIGTLGKLVGTAALLSAVKGTLAYADALDDASKQTGIAVDQYQKLKFAAQQNNVEMNTLTGSIGVFQDRLSGGDKSAVAALRKMNLEWGTLQKLSPDKQLLAISDGIKQVVGQENKVAALNDLFGKQGRELLPLLSGNMRELMQAAEDTGQVMDAELVKSLADANDNIDQLKTSGTVLIGTVLQPLLPILRSAAEQATAFASGLGLIFSSKIFSDEGQRKLASLADKLNPIARLMGSTVGLTPSEITNSGSNGRFTGATLPGSPGGPAVNSITGPGLGPDGILSGMDGSPLGTVEGVITRMNKSLGETNKLTNKSASDAERMAKAFSQVTDEIRAMEMGSIDGRATPFGTPVEGWNPTMEMPGLQAILQFNALMTGQGMAAMPQGRATPFGTPLEGMTAEDSFFGAGAKPQGEGKFNLDAFRNQDGEFDFESVFSGSLAVIQGVRSFIDNVMNEVRGLDKTLGLIQQGAGIGSMFGPWGTAIGAAIGGIASLFGPTNATLANDDRDAFLSQFGGAGTGIGSGFNTVAAKLTEATGEAGGGKLFQGLLAADTPEKLRASIAAINAELDKFNAKTQEAADKEGALAAKVEDTANQFAAKTQAIKDQMASLDQEWAQWDKLEAPEEVMGVIERQARDRIAAQKAMLDAQLSDVQQQQQAALEAIGGSIENGFSGAVDAAEETSRRIDDIFEGRRYTIKLDYEYPDGQPGYGGYALGGMVQPKYLAGGGPSGTDTVPAWLTPGEFVMRRSAVDRIGVGALSAMNNGAGGAGTVNHFHISAIDGDSVKRVVQSREFLDSLSEAEHRNTHGRRTRLRNVVA